MLRLSTPGNEKFIQADEFDINYGGSEANVAVSLANYGYDTEFVTAIPDNPIGDCAVAAVRKYNVGTKFISRSGDRLGIYYLEPGSQCARPILCMTAPVLPLPARQRICSILTPFSRMRTGFILPASLRHFPTARQSLRRRH